MAQSDFNENDYQNRQAGLQAWLNGAGNATPAVPAYPDQTAQQQTISPMQAYIAGKIAQQNQSAQNAGYDTSEVNADQTQSAAPNSDNPGPYAVAGALAKDSFSGGQSSQPQTPLASSMPAANSAPSGLQSVMDSGPMSFLAGGSPFFRGLKDYADNKAAAAAIQNIPSGNDPTIATLQQQAQADPSNGRQYASALSQYMANNQSPEARTRTEEAAIDLAQKKIAMQKFQAGMAAAAADAPGGGTQPAPITIPQAGGSLRGQPMPSTGSIAGAMNAMPNGIVAPIGGSAANPPPLPGGTQPAPVTATPAQPMTPQQQHIELLRQQAAAGLIPYSEYVTAKDPTNPANIPTQKMEGDTLFSAKPGEAPAPYAVPPMNGSGFKQGADGVIMPSKTFGFVTQPHTTATLKIAQDQDKLMQQGDQNNNNVIKDMQRQLDILQDTLPHLNTGGTILAHTNPMNAAINAASPWKTAGMQDQADSYSKAEMAGKTLALDAQGLNKTPGSSGGRAGKLALSVTIDSKPGVDKTPSANISQINDIRSNLADLETSRDLYQKYREMSPYGVTDDNTRQLDDALKTIYPTSTNDANGNVVFNQHNADVIRSIIPHAIANPVPYLKQASMMNQTGTPSYDPNKAAATAAATAPKAMNFDAQGNLIK